MGWLFRTFNNVHTIIDILVLVVKNHKSITSLTIDLIDFKNLAKEVKDECEIKEYPRRLGHVSMIYPIHLNKLKLLGLQLNICQMKYLKPLFLSNVQSLRKLDLSNNEIGFEEIAFLYQNFLKNNKSLEYLNLTSNEIEDDSMKILCAFFENHNAIKKVILSENFISDKGMEYLAKALRKNKSLELLFLLQNPEISISAIFEFAETIKKTNTACKVGIFITNNYYEIETLEFDLDMPKNSNFYFDFV